MLGPQPLVLLQQQMVELEPDAVIGEPGPKTLGRARGKVEVADDFDAPLERATWGAGD